MCLGIPGQVVAINDSSRQLATVDIAGIKRQVNIACIVHEGEPAEACIGVWVLVHVGFAMARIEENEAYETLKLLKELGEAQQEIEAMEHSAKS